MKVLVTGGGGFLGGAVVEKLLEAGHDVTSFSRREHDNLKELDVRSVKGDLTIKDDVINATKGMDAVIHTAAKVGFWGDHKVFHMVNVEGTDNIIEACRKNGVKDLIFTSSPSVIFNGKDMEGVDESVPYPDEYDSFYSETKATAEKHVLDANSSELRTISIRPHLIWGPGDTHLIPGIVQRAGSGKMVKVGNCKNVADMVYIDNAADAHVLALEALENNKNCRGRSFFITNDEPRNMWDFIDQIISAAGLEPTVRRYPAGLATVAASVIELYYRVFKKGQEPHLSVFLVKELTTSHWYDISAAKKELGYKPKISMDDGLKKLKEWFDSEGIERR